MAFELLITQTVRMACDRCGKTQAQYYASVEESIAAATATRTFVDAGYRKGGAVFQAWLCCDCHGEKPQPDVVVEGKS